MPSEHAIEGTVCSWLEMQGFIPLKVGHEGWPDRCIILGLGKHVWMEFKTPTGKLRAQQVNRIHQLTEIREVVLVVTSLEDAQTQLTSLRLPSPLSTYGNRPHR